MKSQQQTVLFKRGYMTMTADILHPGHMFILETARKHCDCLIVGLTSDLVATKQKRKPYHDFSFRKTMLESCKFVDCVVEHAGVSKQDAYKSIGFNILFMGSDHKNNPEYISFEKDYPEVEVMCIERLKDMSSTKIIQAMESNILNNMNVKAVGIGGHIINIHLDKSKSIIIKPINLGKREVQHGTRGEDVYKISNPLPRNWKKKKDESPGQIVNTFPMISGVNGWRELLVVNIIQGTTWSPFLYSRCVLKDDRDPPAIGLSEIQPCIERMLHERKYPSEVHWVYQKDCGDTMAHFFENYLQQHSKEETWEKLQSICQQVQLNIQELHDLGVVHGDLHPENICIDSDGVVGFIDFGWCMSDKFNMSAKETAYYNKCLANNFDLIHFKESLEIWDIFTTLKQ